MRRYSDSWALVCLVASLLACAPDSGVRRPFSPALGQETGVVGRLDSVPDRSMVAQRARSRAVGRSGRVELDHDDVAAIADRGVLRLLRGDDDDAVARLAAAADRSNDRPEAARIWNDLAVAHLNRADTAIHPFDRLEAWRAAERAVTLAPREPAPRFNRAFALAGLGLRRLASSAWREAIDAEAAGRASPDPLAEELQARIETLYLEIRRGASEPALKSASAALFDALIRPLRSHLADVERLTIVPDRALARVPFTALYDQRRGGYLVERWSVALAPRGITLFRVTIRSVRTPGSK